MTERARPQPPTMRPALGPELPSHGDPLAGSSGPSLTLTPRQFTLEIVRRVAREHDVEVKDILGPSRARHLTAARQQAMIEVVEAYPHWSYPDVGRVFNRDHTTVMHAVQKHGRWVPRGRNHSSQRLRALDAAKAIGQFLRNLDLGDQPRWPCSFEGVTVFALPQSLK